jgi:hypothetical protein
MNSHKSTPQESSILRPHWNAAPATPANLVALTSSKQLQHHDGRRWSPITIAVTAQTVRVTLLQRYAQLPATRLLGLADSDVMLWRAAMSCFSHATNRRAATRTESCRISVQPSMTRCSGRNRWAYKQLCTSMDERREFYTICCILQPCMSVLGHRDDALATDNPAGLVSQLLANCLYFWCIFHPSSHSPTLFIPLREAIGPIATTHWQRTIQLV